jgi:hypothetical protein
VAGILKSSITFNKRATEPRILPLSETQNVDFLNNNQNTKGFINGTKLIKQDPIQLVNLEVPRSYQYNHTKIKNLKAIKIRRKIITLFLVATLTFLPLAIYFWEFNNDDSNINIDGEFEDWEGYQSYYDSKTDQITNPSANLIEIKFAESNSELFLFAKVYEKMFDRVSGQLEISDPSKLYNLYHFIENDKNPQTGYSINGLGADIVVKIQGQNGGIYQSSIHLFSDDYENNDWNGWFKLGDTPSALAGNMLEVAIPYVILSSNQLAFCSFISDGNNNYDISDSNIGIGQTAINIEIKNIASGIVQNSPRDGKSKAISLLDFEITTFGSTVTLESLRCFLSSNVAPDNAGFFKVEINHNFKYSDNPSSEFFEFKLKPLTRQMNSNDIYHTLSANPENIQFLNSETYFARLLFIPNEDQSINNIYHMTITPDSFRFSEGEIYFKNMQRNINIDFSFNEINEEIKIDGSFMDWYNKNNNIDIDSNSLENKNIDLQSYNVFKDENYISFFFSVKGFIMSGIQVPEQPRLQASRAQIINPDKSPSNRVVVSKTGQKNPAKSAIPEELKGMDKAYIFIDSDANVDTGYFTDWIPIGAEYAFEISGKNGEIINKKLMQFSEGKESDWPWEYIQDVPAAKNHNQLETQTALKNLDIQPNRAWKYFIYITDWHTHHDDAGSSAIISQAQPMNLPSTLEYLLKRNNSRASTDPGDVLNSIETHSKTRGLQIGNSSQNTATGENTQYKLVRDSKGIWFAFWQNENKIYAANTTNPSGKSWNQEFVLIGSSGKAVDTSKNVNFTSVAIYRESGLKKDRIHLVCRSEGDDVLYIKLVDTQDFQNSSGNAWKNADESRVGFELLDGTFGLNINAPVVVVNSTNVPHVIWSQSISDSELYYTRASAAGWSTPVLIARISKGFYTGIATFDVSPNDYLNIVWLNGTTGKIYYKGCPQNLDSTDPSNWLSVNRGADNDTVLTSVNKFLYPSMVVDSNNNTWVVAQELSVNDIWYNKCTSGTWIGSTKFASTDDLINPSIGADNNGNVHMVWLNQTTNEILYAYYTDKWSNNYTLANADGNSKYFPNIERHWGESSIYTGFVYTNTSSKDTYFKDTEDIEIPEITEPFQIIAICSTIFVLNFVLRSCRREKLYEFDKKQ